MATVVEFTVAADAFPLGRISESLPEASVELERIVPTDDSLFPYVWIRGASAPAVEHAFADAAAPHSLTLVDDLGEEGLLYRATWDEDVDGIVTAITETPVTLLSGTCRDGVWTFRLRVDDHESVTRFHELCLEHGIDVSISQLRTLSRSVGPADVELTAPQFEALALAFDRGYFDDPRRVTLEDLAVDLGISRQSLAGRIRRGHRNLLARVFAEGTTASVGDRGRRTST